MQQQKKNDGDIFDFGIALILAIVPMLAILACRFVLFPLAKWGGKKIWIAVKKHYAKPRTKKQKEAAVTPTLPTPDIFKGAPNLAPMKEFKL